MPEKIESGEGGTRFFKFNWEIRETAKGKLLKTIKIRADSLEEAKGMLHNSEGVISEFIKEHEKKEE